MKRILPCLALLLCLHGAFAQQPTGLAQRLSLSGQVTDKAEGSALPGAYVHLVRLPDSTAQVTATDREGRFTFRPVRAGQYSLQVSFIGYETARRTLEVKEESLQLEPIRLEMATNQLKEVVVQGEVAAAELKGDTIVYNAAAFKTNKNANADELVEKLPGITIEDGKVQAEGENVTRVTVDGRTYFGDDALSTLRNLPAEVIDKVEVFDRPSDQAEMSGVDDGERFKSLNIVTKVNMRNGKFGRAYAGAGNDQRYLTGGTLNVFRGGQRFTVLAQSNNVNQQNFASEDFLGINAGAGSRGGGGGRGGRGSGGGGGGGNAGDFQVGQRNGISVTNALGLNYNDYWGEKIDVSGSYFFTRITNSTFRNLNREFILARNAGQEYQESSRSNSQDYEHRLNLRLNYKISRQTTLRLTPTLTAQQNTGFSSTEAQTTRQEVLLNQTRNRFTTELDGLNFNNNMILSHRFAKPGRSASLSLTTGYNSRDGLNYLASENRSFSGSALQDLIDQSAVLTSQGWRLGANLSLTERLGKKSTALFNYNASYQYTDSDKRTMGFQELMQEYSLLDTALSNTFNNEYLTQRVGPGYRYNHQKLQFSTQVAYQTATLDRAQQFPRAYDFARSFHNVVPTASVRYRFQPRKDLSLNYRTNTNAPSVNQMQEVINNSNPLHLRTGNPDLDQTYQHNLSLRYAYAKPETSRVFSATLNGNVVNNYITNASFIADRDTLIAPTIILPAGGQFTRPVNLDGSYSLRGNLNYGMPFKLIKSKVNFTGSSNYARTPGLVNNRLNFNENLNFGLGATLGSNISEHLDFTLSSRSSYNLVLNSLRAQTNTRFYNQNSNLRLRWVVWKGFIMEHNMNHRLNRGLAADFNQSVLRWNASVGKTLFKDQRGEIKLTAFDMLNQNTNIYRTVSDIYIQDVETQAMTRYFMVSFNYNFRKFGNGPTPEAGERPGGLDRERRERPAGFEGGRGRGEGGSGGRQGT